MAINKIVLDGTTLIDLTTDTVASPSDIAQGKVGHLNDGSVVTGTASGGGGLPTITDMQVYPVNISGLEMPIMSEVTWNVITAIIDMSGTNYINSGKFYTPGSGTNCIYCFDFGESVTDVTIKATKTASSNRFRFAFFDEDPTTFTTDTDGIGYYPTDNNNTTPEGTVQIMHLSPPYSARYMVVSVSNENTTTPAPTVAWAEI